MNDKEKTDAILDSLADIIIYNLIISVGMTGKKINKQEATNILTNVATHILSKRKF